MKVNDPNLQGPGSLTSTGVSKPAGAGGAASSARTGHAPGQDGVFLSTLAQSLQNLDSESPERLTEVTRLAQAYAGGAYEVDPQATAGGVIEDALKHR